MPTACFLSPHLDDAVFSAGGTMAALADDGWRVTLITVFTRSVPNPTGFALRCQTDKGLPADVDYMAVRRAEDAAAAAALGLPANDVVWLDLPEAPHRGYGSAAELFAGVHPDDVGTATAVAEAMASHLVGVDAVFVPTGIGNHVDHVHVVAAADNWAAATRMPLVRWHDTPYVLRLSTPPAADHAVDITATLERKLAGCAAYGTQLGFQFGGVGPMRDRLTVAAGPTPVERFDVGRDGAIAWGRLRRFR